LSRCECHWVVGWLLLTRHLEWALGPVGIVGHRWRCRRCRCRHCGHHARRLGGRAFRLHVFDKLLDGDLRVLDALRQQRKSMKVVERQMTGVGFFTKSCVADSHPKAELPQRASLGDVVAEVTGLEHTYTCSTMSARSRWGSGGWRVGGQPGTSRSQWCGCGESPAMRGRRRVPRLAPVAHRRLENPAGFPQPPQPTTTSLIWDSESER